MAWPRLRRSARAYAVCGRTKGPSAGYSSARMYAQEHVDAPVFAARMVAAPAQPASSGVRGARRLARDASAVRAMASPPQPPPQPPPSPTVPWGALCFDVLLGVLKHLDARALGPAALVCRHWHAAATCPALWRRVAVGAPSVLAAPAVLGRRLALAGAVALDLRHAAFGVLSNPSPGGAAGTGARASAMAAALQAEPVVQFLAATLAGTLRELCRAFPRGCWRGCRCTFRGSRC